MQSEPITEFIYKTPTKRNIKDMSAESFEKAKQTTPFILFGEVWTPSYKERQRMMTRSLAMEAKKKPDCFETLRQL